MRVEYADQFLEKNNAVLFLDVGDHSIYE